jgi:putative membrane-bound dehydrogenase-like protein
MKRLVLAGVFVALAASWSPADKPPAPATHQVQLNGHTFTLPLGFEIELAAAPPLVDRPIVADLDEQGRLYVADSSGSNDRVDQQLRNRPHRILRLEDTDGDGRYDRRRVFADKMMFPEGALWFSGSLYVAAPPSIWKLTDTQGDGVADQRVEWFQGKTLTGCANDLHGPYLGPDGWIYWCKGAFARQTYERSGKPPFVTRAAHIFRCRPDGTGIEPVMTGGMDNPVEVVFTPGGERIFTTTFLQHPGGGRRDGLIHAIYGGVYGKEHDVIEDHKRTGPGVMPVLTHLGAAAPAGLMRYESRLFGAEYQDNLFAALFNMQKITRHILEPAGATFKTRDEDFLISDNRDFHPTDVLEDADGSLLVVDTGGWYKLCCPTSQLHKPDVLGAIYRVRRKGAPRLEDPRGLKLAWGKMKPEDLAKLLDDERPAVRRRAIQTLAAKGAEAIPALADAVGPMHSVQTRRNAVWSATRIPSERARAIVRTALDDADETVRQAAIHSASLWRDVEATPILLKLLPSHSAHNQRAAAEALGRIGAKAAVPVLLAALGKPTDRVLEHSLLFALIEIADRSGTTAGLQSENVLTRRAALIALDQMDQGGLGVATVAAELVSPHPQIKETASWIASRHPEWGEGLTGFLRQRVAAKTLSAAEHEELIHQLARFAQAQPVQELLAEQIGQRRTRDRCQLALQAMARSGLKQAPQAWITGLTVVLNSEEKDLLPDAIAAVRALPYGKTKPENLLAALLRVGANDSFPVNVRLSALAALPTGMTEVPGSLFAFLRSHLDRDEPVVTRSLAGEVLSHAKLTNDQLLGLTEALKTTGPMEVDRLLEAFVQSNDDHVGHSLIAALQTPTVRSSLRADTLKPRLAKYSPSVRQQAEALYASLNLDAEKQKTRLDELLTHLQGGEVRRGQAVFNSAKTACSSCHAIGYLGGNVGPDLTHIGRIRSERDLLEAIVFPSASFVRSYEPVLVTTKAGKTFNGVLRKDAPEEIILATSATEQVRIARADIEDMQPGKVSVMPAGMDQQLTPRELADLVAFLKACK